jgi:hypothetical protein
MAQVGKILAGQARRRIVQVRHGLVPLGHPAPVKR